MENTIIVTDPEMAALATTTMVVVETSTPYYSGSDEYDSREQYLSMLRTVLG